MRINIKSMAVLLFTVLAIGLTLSLVTVSVIKPVKIDMASINEIVQDTQKDMQIKALLQKEGYMLIQKQSITTMYSVIIATFGFLTLTLTLYLLYLHRVITKPFEKLKQFASSIAAGRLDHDIRMDRHNIFGAFTESFDIMRTELKRARDNENLANKAKKELIAGLSHDIKTPVASIKAISELLLATVSDPKITDRVEIIYSKTEQIDHLITDMFNATLEELGELKVTVEEVYSSILISLIKESDYLNKATLEDIPQCIIKADTLRLGQVIDNIISNSYKYANTPIEISFNLTKAHMEMDISDYGGGVSEEELPLLFGKFYRGNNAVSQSGSGLGLYISKHFMQMQGGDIVCYNKTDGFTVKLIIPI